MRPVEYRSELYDVFADPGGPVEAKIDRALEMGTEYLDLSVGFFTRIDEGVQEIVRSTGDHPLIQPGETCPLEEAYCRRTIEIESPLAVTDAAVSTAISDAAFETFDLGAYVGARVVVDDEPYGTVCFADAEPRTEFTDAERYFVEILARLAGQAIERRDYERELEKREADVRKRDAIYRAVVDASFDLVFGIDTEGRFTYVSETVEDLLGYTPGEYVGEPFVSMLPDEETIEVANEVYEAVMAGETVERMDFPLQHRSGESVLVDIRVTPLFSGEAPPEERGSEDIVGIQGMARDARGRQRRQRLIRVLNRVLRHNLRNEMGVVGGYAEALQDRLDGEDAAYARRIREASERLVSLGDTARELEANLDSPPELAAEDVVPAVTRAAGRIEEAYPDATVTVDTPGSAVAKSAPRLETALLELVDNAARHAGEAPSIAVTVRVVDGRVTIQVCDDGPGLPEQERSVLVSGEETPLVHGSGLGLWLVHWIVTSLDGDLAVRDGEGTCVEVSLERPDEGSGPGPDDPGEGPTAE